MKKFSHIDSDGKASMVDVSGKVTSIRTAEAEATVNVTKELLSLIQQNQIAKGDVFSTARIAGIQAAKLTAGLIPLCHNIFISKVDVDFQVDEISNTIKIQSFCKTESQTGIEMEALMAVSVAALTIYDMCKAVDKGIFISKIKLLSKTGGKSGDYLDKV
ncbi:MAG: cyclic pyranopterin monophosphate synthase MoaC [Ignavibacteriaceae bacterium]|nr:cyclic pyranopterin monophosphate synthase MoaC [Ignavibacteriaceae bacterium]